MSDGRSAERLVNRPIYLNPCVHLYISIYLSFSGVYAFTLISVSARRRPSRFVNFSDVAEQFNNAHYVNCIAGIFQGPAGRTVAE